MTKIEQDRCIKLMNEAFIVLKNSEKEYKNAEKHLQNSNKLEWEIEQRKADQHYGYALGINQALVVLGFEHDEMKRLGDKL